MPMISGARPTRSNAQRSILMKPLQSFRWAPVHLLGCIRSPIVLRQLHAKCVASGNMQCLVHMCRMSPLAARQRWGIGRVPPVLTAPTRGCNSITCVLRRHGQDLGQADGGGGETRQVLRVRHSVHDAAGAASFPFDRHCQSCSCHPSTKLSSTRLLCLKSVTCVVSQQLRASTACIVAPAKAHRLQRYSIPGCVTCAHFLFLKPSWF